MPGRVEAKNPRNSLAAGCGYFLKGARLIWHPALRPYLLVPLLVNAVLFFVLTGLLIHFLGGLTSQSLSEISPWLKPLANLLFFVIGVLTLIIYGYSFNLITNIIAAPFYGMLAGKTEQLLTGNTAPAEPLSKMLPRVMGRELQKLLYFITRGVLIIIIVVFVSTIPILNMFAPVIGFLWAMWSMSIQYVDYHADNHQYAFSSLRKRLWKRAFSSFSFGGMVMGCSVVPFVNIFAMPAAVVGGTLFWLNELEELEIT